MSTDNAGNAEDLAILRDKAKELGIKHYHVLGYEKLYPLVMEAYDKKAEVKKAKDAKELAETKKVAKKRAGEVELYPFANAQGQIELWMLTDTKNEIPRNEKGTAYKFVRMA